MSDEEINRGDNVDEIHPSVQLMLDRMATNPEEFIKAGYHGHQWQPYLDEIRQFANSHEKKLLKMGERNISLEATHKRIVQKLLEGPETSDELDIEAEYERNLMQRTQNMLLGHQQQARNTLKGVNPTHVWMDDYAHVGIGAAAPSQTMTIASTGTGAEAMRVQANNEIKIGNETLSEGLLKQIKKGLGI